MSDHSASGARRSGAETRLRAQKLALSLFSSQGYEATSMQQIADGLGIKKPSLYYHFAGKEDIVRSLLEGRSAEARELVDWVRGRPPGPGLLREALLKWIDSFSLEKLRGIRFMNANPLLVRSIATAGGVHIGTDLEPILELVLPEDADPRQVLLARMAFLSISTAVGAARDVPGLSDTDAIAAARVCAIALADAVEAAGSAPPPRP